MKETIIFGIALTLTAFLIEDIICYFLKRDSYSSDESSTCMAVLSVLLWTYFYYLTHKI